MRLRVLALVAYAVALGILSAVGWRLHVGLLDLLAGLQAVWGLGAWLTGRVVGGGPGRGAAAGAVFGAGAIATYYLTEAVADSLHSAWSQLASSGRFWVPAALLGGAVFGALGTSAAAPDRGRWLEPAALSYAVMVGGMLAESAFVQRSGAVLGHPARLELATTVLVVIALVLMGIAWVRTSARALVVAAVVAAVTVPVVASVFLLIEHRYGYVTL